MNPMLQVFKKEIQEMFRDKRTRSAAFFGPIFMMIFFICGFGSVIGDLGKPESLEFHYVKSSNPFIAELREKKFKVTEVPSVEAGEKLIREGKARIVLDFGPVPQRLEQQQVVTAYYDVKQQKAQVGISALSKSFAIASDAVLKKILSTKGIPETAAEPIKLVEKIVKVGEGGASEFIVGLLPYLIVIWAFYGGFALATDLVAGEKEKLTLETLLITPVTRTQIVLGKFLALASLCLISSVMSVLGLVLVSVLKLPGSSFMLKDGLGLTPMSILMILLVLLPTVAMFASLLLSFSAYAKNSREAQSYISLASFVVVIPAAFSQLIGLTDAGNQNWVNFVPVLNAANNIRNVLLGKPDWAGTAITILVCGLISAALVAVVIKLFNREEVLTRT